VDFQKFVKDLFVGFGFWVSSHSRRCKREGSWLILGSLLLKFMLTLLGINLPFCLQYIDCGILIAMLTHRKLI
jgi:hypothetical protein